MNFSQELIEFTSSIRAVFRANGCSVDVAGLTLDPEAHIVELELPEPLEDTLLDDLETQLSRALTSDTRQPRPMVG